MQRNTQIFVKLYNFAFTVIFRQGKIIFLETASVQKFCTCARCFLAAVHMLCGQIFVLFIES